MKTIYCCQILNMSSRPTDITLLNFMEYFCGINFQMILRENAILKSLRA